jgi:hypothetical protein
MIEVAVSRLDLLLALVCMQPACCVLWLLFVLQMR